jgi:hypothetical protein
MKRCVIAAAALVVAAMTAPAAAQAPTQDSVTGDGAFLLYGATATTWKLDAHSGPSGENPTGTLTQFFSYLPEGVEREVTCVAVSGNTAIVGWSDGGAPWALYVRIEDNGSPGLGRDRIALSNGTEDRPSTCPTATDLIWTEFWVLTGGDYRVVDGQPLPASKEQCKDNGWKTFGVFKNQGDCVSFVARRGGAAP